MGGTLVEVEVTELRRALEGDVTLVDVREYGEYAGGRVAGARLIPLGHVGRRADEIDRHKPIYVICRTGRRSAQASRELRALGFERVMNVRGGVMAWEQAGLPLVRDERAPWSLERQVRFVAGTIVLAGVLLSVFVAQPFVWLAGLIGLGLAFSAATDTCAMGLLLARLPWNANDAPGAEACTPGGRAGED